MLAFLFALLGTCFAVRAPPCTSRTPTPSETKCTLEMPSEPEFATICSPGAIGHLGGAEKAVHRCGGLYADGVFRCACCGAHLFYAVSKFERNDDGWPAFHANGAVITNGTSSVCNPRRNETVCSNCGAHLGDYFADGGPAATTDYFLSRRCVPAASRRFTGPGVRSSTDEGSSLQCAALNGARARYEDALGARAPAKGRTRANAQASR